MGKGQWGARGRAWVALAITAIVAGCASAPQTGDVRQAIASCNAQREGAACRQLAALLAVGEVPTPLAYEAEQSVLKACWSDHLVDARLGTDARWRLCYEAGKHFSSRAIRTMEEPDTNFRKIAAHLYLRSCELGQPQGCRLLLSECLLLDEDLCRAPPSQEQAQLWASQRRARDARARER
jgi:hypothetical protein